MKIIRHIIVLLILLMTFATTSFAGELTNVSVVTPVSKELTPVGDLKPVGGLKDVTLPTDVKLPVGEIETDPPTIAYQLSDINSATIGEELSVSLSLAFANNGNKLSFSTNKGELEGLNLKYTPVSGDVIDGKVNIIVKVSDKHGRIATNKFYIYVEENSTTPVNNQAPVVINPIDNITGAISGEEIVIDLTKIFSDLDGDTLTYAVSDGGVFKQSSSTYRYTPPETMVGKSKYIRIKAIDTEHSLMVEDSFTIGVVAEDVVVENRAPIVISPIADIVNAETYVEISINLSDIFSDPDGDSLTFAVSTGGDFEERSSTYRFIPTPDMIGNVNTVRIRAIDTEHGLWVEESFNFTVVELVLDMPPTLTEPEEVLVTKKLLFNDTDKHWGKNAIEVLAEKGVINGKSETTFAPNDTITRAEFITLIVRYYDFTTNVTENFIDVEKDKWYTDYVRIAKGNGLLPNIYGEKFEPNKDITREEMMYILYESIVEAGAITGVDDISLSIDIYTDKSSISSYAYKSADYLVRRDVIHGYNNMINPRKTSTRAEVAQMLYSLLEN